MTFWRRRRGGGEGSKRTGCQGEEVRGCVIGRGPDSVRPGQVSGTASQPAASYDFPPKLEGGDSPFLRRFLGAPVDVIGNPTRIAFLFFPSCRKATEPVRIIITSGAQQPRFVDAGPRGLGEAGFSGSVLVRATYLRDKAASMQCKVSVSARQTPDALERGSTPRSAIFCSFCFFSSLSLSLVNGLLTWRVRERRRSSGGGGARLARRRISGVPETRRSVARGR